MDINKTIEIHAKAIECLEAIKVWDNMIMSCEHSIATFGEFVSTDKFEHSKEIYQNCQVRVAERYAKLLNELNESIFEE